VLLFFFKGCTDSKVRELIVNMKKKTSLFCNLRRPLFFSFLSQNDVIPTQTPAPPPTSSTPPDRHCQPCNCITIVTNHPRPKSPSNITITKQTTNDTPCNHRHILNMARALRFQGNIPIKFWGKCILTVVYLINRTPSTILNGKTPYEMLYGHQPTYEHLRIFDSLCYAHSQRRNDDKFVSRSKKCVFIGYPYDKKGWKLFDLETKEIFVSRDVEFVETKW